MENMRKMSVSSLLRRGNKGASVRRCLFGPVDHEENNRFLKQQLKIQEQESCKKWNFDFNTMTPLDGKYAWEPVVEGEIPAAYDLKQLTKPTATRARTPLGLSSRLNANIVPLPTKVDTCDSVYSSVDVLRESAIESSSENVPKRDNIAVSSSQQVNNKEAKDTSSTVSSQESFVSTVSRTSPKRKLNQTDLTGERKKTIIFIRKSVLITRIFLIGVYVHLG